MKTYKYDILIIGGGPIGASTFYFLKDSAKKVALIRPEPLNEDNDHIATYLYAGGSIRWYFEDEDIKLATLETAQFIDNLKNKVDLSLIEDNYVFAHKGVMIPSFNIAGSKLVNYFIEESKNNNKDLFEKTYLLEIKKENDNYLFITNNGVFTADKALIAIGHSIRKFFPNTLFEFEKRQLFVLDYELKDEQKNFPHLIVPFADGVLYLFVKKIGEKYKFVLGQEDIIEENESFEGNDYLDELKKFGICKIFKFLENTKVEKVLWGFDATNKKFRIEEIENKIFIASCGSAVRSCVYIGRVLSQKLLN